MRRERCLRKIPRYSPLRELATARRQALLRDEPTGWSATRSAMNRIYADCGSDPVTCSPSAEANDAACGSTPVIPWLRTRRCMRRRKEPGRRVRAGGQRVVVAATSVAERAYATGGSGNNARQVEASAGCGAYTAGKVSAEDSAILTVAGACDGTTSGLAVRRTHRVVCNQICDEPNKNGPHAESAETAEFCRALILHAGSDGDRDVQRGAHPPRRPTTGQGWCGAARLSVPATSPERRGDHLRTRTPPLARSLSGHLPLMLSCEHCMPTILLVGRQQAFPDEGNGFATWRQRLAGLRARRHIGGSSVHLLSLC
jgi:hypothetical protein